MNLEGALLAFCNPLLDVSANVDKAFLAKYGLKENDAIILEDGETGPLSGLFEDLIASYPVSYLPGGAGQNTARAAQWLLPPRTTVYIGCVGKDDNGRKLKEISEGDGVVVEYMEVEGEPTGRAAALINGTSRSLVAQLGAASRYHRDHLLEAALQKRIDSARLIYITGFFLTTSPETIQHMATLAHEHGKALAMNLSAPFLSRAFKEPMLDALPYVDMLFGNESEALAFAGANHLGTEDTAEIARRLAEWPRASPDRKRLVVITHGPDPTLVTETGSSEIRSFPTPYIPAEEIVDTNGAGDAFVGGFLSQFIQGKGLEASITMGHKLAGFVIRAFGVIFPKERPAEFTVKF